MMRDLRFALRFMLRRPGFVSVVVFSLAIAIGANTAIFSIIDAVLLGSLPIRESDRVVGIFTLDEKNPGHLPISDLNSWDVREQATDVLDTAHYTFCPSEIEIGETRIQQAGQLVTSNYFDVLGVEFLHGRGFDHDDRALGSHPEVVLAYDLWVDAFGADPDVVGRSLIINGARFDVVGVTGEGFSGVGLGPAALFMPYSSHREVSTTPGFANRRWLTFAAVARLRGDATIDAAKAELDRIGQRLAATYPKDNKGRTFTAVPITHAVLGPDQREGIVMAGTMLMTVAGFILLIACANAANLLLARASGRRSEVAVRRVLGASAGRIVRQLLTESVLLSSIAGLIGLAVALPLRDFIWSLRPDGFVFGGLEPELNLTLLLFTAAVAVLTGIAFGLAPALRLTRVDLMTPLKEETTPTASVGAKFGSRSLLVVLQVALSMMALVGAGLFIRSMDNARRVHPGFEAERLLLAAVDMQKVKVPPPALSVEQQQVVEAIAAVPEVEAVALAARAPMDGGIMQRTTFVEGRASDAEDGVLIHTFAIGPGYFDVVGQPLLEGRSTTDTDLFGKPRVVVVNETFAQRYWPDGGAIGHRLRFIGEEEPLTIVGVVGTAKLFTPMEEPVPALYVPLAQWPQPVATLIVRTISDPVAASPAIEDASRELGADIGVDNFRPMSQQIDNALAAPRAGALLLGLLGFVALVLASIGIYGLMTYVVRQRTREIGIRMALGARPADVLRFVLLQAMTMVVVGIGLGTVGALLLQQRLAPLLFDVPMADPLAFGGAVFVLAFTALAAGYIPARHATRINPSLAIHHD